LNYAEFDGRDEFLIGQNVVGLISGREKVIELFKDVREQQADPYTALTRNHVQSRKAAIRNGQENPNAYEELPDYDEYWDE
jgi:phospholipid-binding lipoprotein MlaA